MKRLIAFVIAAMMILTMLPVMAISTSATSEDDWKEWNIPAASDGFWSTYRDIKEYSLAVGEPFTPAGGFKYDSEGFHTISPVFDNMGAKYTVVTSEPQDLTDGFYMQVRIDEFAYDGGNGSDEWISFFVSDTPTLAQGAKEFGNYWCNLVRGTGDGKANAESWVGTATTDGTDGGFAHKGSIAIDAPMDADGKESYTLEIVYENGAYIIKMNGVTMPGDADYSKAISSYEQCFVGFTFHSTVKDQKASATILKFGHNASDAAPQTSGPDKEPEVSKIVYGPMVDASTVPANTPALLFDGTMSTVYGEEPMGSNLGFSKNADGTWKLTATDATPYFMWPIKYDLTYAAEDFPVFGMMLRNYNGDDGGIYYAAGDVSAPTNTCTAQWSIWDLYETVDADGNVVPPASREYTHEDDAYVFVTIDLTGMNEWKGRIHSIRPDFKIDTSNPDDPSLTVFDIGFMGMFRSLDEAMAYSDKYITDLGGTFVEQTQTETKPETETESTSESATAADTAKTTTATTEAAEEGCASVVGFASVAILSAAAAAVALKRKH